LKGASVSTLTKVLVVLLTLSAIFLCGIVVTYAASAANYKLKHDDAMTENKSLSASAAQLQAQLNEGLKAKQDEIASLQDQLNKSVAENGKLQSETLTLKASRDELQERVNGWSGTMQKNTQIVADLQQQLASTREELDKLRNELVTDRGQLSQARAALEDKTLQLKSLEREKMRLIEDKTALENKLGGRPSATRPAVTAPVSAVKAAAGPTPKVVLQGRINEVRLDSMLATINIGSANGVKAGDTLHVIRGDQFVCSIYVTTVDTDNSAGQITTLKAGLQPKEGDMVTNKL
jgi:septal ring factor EnvC (AmiA/AmiB activator)